MDECPKCGGFWLDVGELGKIRSQYKSDEERKQAAKAVYDDLFDHELDRMRQEPQEKKEKAQRHCKDIPLYLSQLLHTRQTKVGRFLAENGSVPD